MHPQRLVSGSPSSQAGFTLFEVLVTLVVLGLALVLVIGYKPPWSAGLGLRGAASEIAGALRRARSEAIVQNRTVGVTIDLDRRRFQVDAAPARQLPPQLNLALLTLADERQGVRRGAIRFNPDGSSTGGRVSVSDGHETIAVGVEWLTGRVAIANVR